MSLNSSDFKKKLKKMGCDLIGIAPVERFVGSPFLPETILPGAKCVVVIGSRIPLAATENWVRYRQSYHVYGHGWLNFHLSFLDYNAAIVLEDNGYRAYPLGATEMYNDDKRIQTGSLSLRHAAVAAGLGEFGWSNLVLTPEFGPRVRFTALITTASLKPDPLYQGSPLCLGDSCKLCAKNCPMGCFTTEDKTVINIDGKVCEMAKLTYERKYECRWCEHGLTTKGGATTEFPLPEEYTVEEYYKGQNMRDEYQKRRSGFFNGMYFCGRCVHACPGEYKQLGKKWRTKRKS